MDEKLNEKASEYAKLLSDLRMQVGDNEAALVILSELGKDRRVEKMAVKSFSNGNGRGYDADATPKQRALLQHLGMPVPAGGLTKAEASRMIDEARAR